VAAIFPSSPAGAFQLPTNVLDRSAGSVYSSTTMDQDGLGKFGERLPDPFKLGDTQGRMGVVPRRDVRDLEPGSSVVGKQTLLEGRVQR
jgi:hypothetical protein